MAKLMWIAGILLMAVGLALAVMVLFSTASMVSWGITPEVAAILFAGGVLALGQGGIINALETARPALAAQVALAPIPEFGRRVFDTTPPAAAAAAETVSPEVKETIRALEQAQQELRQAFEEKPVEPEVKAEVELGDIIVSAPETPLVIVETTAGEPVVEEVVEAEEPAAAEEDDEAVEDSQLYVVEERVIRGRPARILSDGTVEAETEEGWMRFENLEHLDEYLEAMAPAQRA